MISLLLAVLFTQDASEPQPFVITVRPSADKIAEQLVDCGFDRASPRYEEDIEDQVITVVHQGPVDDPQIECAARLYLQAYYWIDFSEPVRSRFAAKVDEIGRPAAIARSRAWLEENNLLENMPIYDADGSDEIFVEQVEEHCGRAAEGLLSSEWGPNVLSPEWFEADGMNQERADALTCVLQTVLANGLPIGMIGNEKVSIGSD